MSVSLRTNPGVPLDTTLDALRVQCELLSRLSPGERLRKTFDLIEFADSIARAGIRRRHPEYCDAQVQAALGRMRLGDELFRAAFPGLEVVP